MDEIINETLTKGVELHVAGEFDLASQLYHSVIKLQPNHADANHNMGLLKLDMGSDLEALPYLQTALQADTSIAQFWLSYIKALVKLEKLDEADRIVRLAVENEIKNEELQELERQLNEKQNKSQLKHADQNISDPPKSVESTVVEEVPQDTIDQLIHLFNQGQFEAVVEQAKYLTKKYPNNFMLWNILGAAQKSLAQVTAALESFKRVTNLNPKFADGFNNFSVVLREQNKLNEAVEACEKAIALRPNYTEAHNNLGNALKDQRKLEEASKAYKQALSYNPNFFFAHNGLGNVLQEQGKLQEAVQAYE